MSTEYRCTTTLNVSFFDPTAMSSYLFIVKIELPHVIHGLLPDNSEWVPEHSTDPDVPDTVRLKTVKVLRFWKR